MNIAPIKTEHDYAAALREIEGLMNAEPDTPEGDRLDILATLVEAWEVRRYPMDLPDPVEAIKYHMEQAGLTRRDLVPYIGHGDQVDEILSRKRPLTLKMIWKLHKGLGIPAASLIKQAEEQAA